MPEHTSPGEPLGLLELLVEEGFDNAMNVLRQLFVGRNGKFKSGDAEKEYHRLRRQFGKIYKR